MKKKKGFELRHLLRENVIISKGKENIDFNKIIVLNESAAYLWEAVGEEEEFTADSLAALLLKEYDTDPDTARTDAVELMQRWADAGICE